MSSEKGSRCNSGPESGAEDFTRCVQVNPCAMKKS